MNIWAAQTFTHKPLKQLKIIMTSGPEYIAERSVWWEECMKAVTRRLHLSKEVGSPSPNEAQAAQAEF